MEPDWPPAMLLHFFLSQPVNCAIELCRSWRNSVAPHPLHKQAGAQQTMSLCERCQSFDIQSFRANTFSTKRGLRIRDVQNSALTGCPFCRYLASAFPAVFGGPEDAKTTGIPTGDWVHLDITTAHASHASNNSLGLNIEFLQATVASNPKLLYQGIYNEHNAGIAMQFRALADPDDAAALSGDVVGRDIFSGTKATNKSLLVPSIQAWLASCYRHAACSQRLSGHQVDQHNPPLPTRCVHVWTDKDTVKFRLQVTAGTRGRYITLSHRWLPDEKMNMTTTTNLQARLTGDSFTPLPLLFQDTITLAARLGIPYVWIDALCIIQGDGSEWAMEAERMADYYQNSLFTIACPSANSLIGLFNNSTEAILQAAPPLIRLPYRNAAGEQAGHFYLCPDQLEEEADYWRNIATSDLLSRGWVFQEWALSRRIICCTATNVFFRCKKSPLHTLSSMIQPRQQWNHMPDFRLRKIFSAFHLSSRDDLHTAWMAIVEAYSELKLTRPSQNRLVALSGVADEFGRALSRQDELELALPPQEGGGSVYVAGLWSTLLLDGLLWEKASKEAHERLSSIPSYSWASVYARVQWSNSIAMGKQGGGHCQVVDILYATSREAVASIDEPSFVNRPPTYRPANNAARDPAQGNRFPVLSLRTKLQPVFLGGTFPTQDDRDLVARLTSQNNARQSSNNWRKVASHLDRERIAGWASLEDAEFRETGSSVIFSLLIFKSIGLTPGLGYATGYYPIFNVLFVRRVKGLINGYERIGMGALFGNDIEKQFRTAVTREVRLI